MTRAEARVLLDNEYHIDMNEYRSADEFLDIIYDDFESRTCENCIHWNKTNNIAISFDCNRWSKNVMVQKDFGCNKFERKTDGDV